MSFDPFSAPLPARRRPNPPHGGRVRQRRRQGVRATNELTLRYEQAELRRAFSAVQSPLAATFGALAFGFGLALALMAAAGVGADRVPTLACGVLLLASGGLTLATPTRQARSLVESSGVDGVVTVRLLLTAHRLVVEDASGTSSREWSTIERVQSHGGYMALVSGGKFVIPPIRIDDEHGPFVSRLVPHLECSLTPLR